MQKYMFLSFRQDSKKCGNIKCWHWYSKKKFGWTIYWKWNDLRGTLVKPCLWDSQWDSSLEDHRLTMFPPGRLYRHLWFPWQHCLFFSLARSRWSQLPPIDSHPKRMKWKRKHDDGSQSCWLSTEMNTVFRREIWKGAMQHSSLAFLVHLFKSMLWVATKFNHTE